MNRKADSLVTVGLFIWFSFYLNSLLVLEFNK